MSALPKHRLTEAEYLEIERAAEFRSEYLDGEMYPMTGAGYRGGNSTLAMAGAGRWHGRILGNTFAALHAHLRGRPCEAFVNDLRVRVADSGLYTYPDIVALCGEPRFLDHREDTLLNPQLIIEVLSPTTESYDRGAKFIRYRQLPSLTDYVLVSQDRMLVEQWSRLESPENWKIREYSHPTDRVRFDSLDAEILLSDIYEGVEFSPEAEAPPP